MSSTQWLLNAVREKLPVKSDYAVAQALGISRSRMSQYMKGQHQISEEKAITRAAEIAGLSLLLVLCRLSADRAQTTAVKDAWNNAVYMNFTSRSVQHAA